MAGRPGERGRPVERVGGPVHRACEPGSATTGAGTAGDLTRAILQLEATEAVAQDEVGDAFAEIENVFGGNIKALLPEHVGLTLPQVSRQSPSTAGAVPLQEVGLAWRGRPLVVCLWAI